MPERSASLRLGCQGRAPRAAQRWLLRSHRRLRSSQGVNMASMDLRARPARRRARRTAPQKPAHPGEGRDPDDRASPVSVKRKASGWPSASALFDLGPGLRRDERIRGGLRRLIPLFHRPSLSTTACAASTRSIIRGRPRRSYPPLAMWPYDRGMTRRNPERPPGPSYYRLPKASWTMIRDEYLSGWTAKEIAEKWRVSP